MKDLELEILEMIDEGLRPTSIARVLNIPLEMVYDCIDRHLITDDDDDIVLPYNEDEL